MMDSKVKVVIHKKDRIEYILSGMCDYYKIDREELLKKARIPERYKRKSYVIKLLRDIADCSFKEIRYLYGNSGENSVWVMYQRISEAIDSKYNSDLSAKQEYEKILKHLGL